MRGDTPSAILISSPGLIANVPPHLAPPNSLISGTFNVYKDIDGYEKPRPGYQPFLPGSTNVPGNLALHGGIGWQDNGGGFQYVVASDAKWFSASSGTWTDITDLSNPNNGAATDPARFRVFYQGGLPYAIGIDNFSTPKWWTSSFLTYQTLSTDTYAIVSISNASTTATVTLASPTTAIIAGDVVTITGNGNAGYNVTVTVNAVLTSTTFTFTTASSGTGLGGSVTDTFTVPAPPARDIEILANRVVLVNTTENGTRYPRRIRWSTSGDATRWPQLAFLDALDNNDAIVGIESIGSNIAIVYGEYSFTLIEAVPGGDANAFAEQEVPNVVGFVGPVSPAAIIQAEGLHYYLGIDSRVYTFDGVTITPISAAADPVYLAASDQANASRSHGAYLSSRRQVWFFTPTMTATAVTQAPSIAEVYDIPNQAILPPMLFSEGVTMSFSGIDSTGLTWLTIPGTWTTSAYTWDDIPTGLEQDIFIGTSSGEVDLLFHGNFDGSNGYIIPWNMTFALYSAPSVLQNLKLNRAEFYFIPNTTVEIVTAQFNKLGFPNDPGTPLVSFAMYPSAGWTTMPTEPGPLNPSNINCNFIQLRLFSSQSLGAVALAGGVLYFYLDDKADYGIA